jgi:hypothetical protein
LGLTTLPILFMREGNAIVAALHKRRPKLREDQTFNTARLIARLSPRRLGLHRSSMAHRH